MKPHVDLNADLGEGCPHDSAILEWVTSANISCGAHAGSITDIRHALRACAEKGVAAGAHPSYPDRENFGRKVMSLGTRELKACLFEQLDFLTDLAAGQGLRLRHVKPHGALYNQAAADEQLATTLAQTIREYDPSLALTALAGSALTRAGDKAGLRVLHEAFADRAYDADGMLLPRTQKGAVHNEVETAIRQSLDLLLKGQILSAEGRLLHLRADTLCLHGDTPDALLFARTLHQALVAAGIEITAHRD